MKIAIICDVLGDANNGTSIAAYNLINTLKNKGHEVNVVCPDPDKEGQPGYYVVPTIKFGVFENYVKNNGVSLAKPDEKIIASAIDGCDIVHIMMPFSLGRAALKIALTKDIPVTAGFHVQAENVTSHLFAMDSKAANKIAYSNLWKGFYRYVDAIHYPTQFICNYVKKFKIQAPKEYVISNGVNAIFRRTPVEKPEEFKDKFVILMTGRYSREKNQIALLKAVHKSKYKDKIQIILAGDGPLKKKLTEYSDKKLKNKPVMVLASREELVKIINMADLYVHTSEVEIEAISVLEALACGVVPLISNSPKSATSKFSLIPESTYNFKSIKALTKGIEYWIEHPDKLKEYSPIYEEFGLSFAFEKCMDEMEKMLLEVIKNHKKIERVDEKEE